MPSFVPSMPRQHNVHPERHMIQHQSPKLTMDDKHHEYLTQSMSAWINDTCICLIIHDDIYKVRLQMSTTILSSKVIVCLFGLQGIFCFPISKLKPQWLQKTSTIANLLKAFRNDVELKDKANLHVFQTFIHHICEAKEILDKKYNQSG